jgi:hypothetical protein
MGVEEEEEEEEEGCNGGKEGTDAENSKAEADGTKAFWLPIGFV